MKKFSELFNETKAKIPSFGGSKTAEEKQQELNKIFALAIADQDRRLLELSGGVSNE